MAEKAELSLWTLDGDRSGVPRLVRRYSLRGDEAELGPKNEPAQSRATSRRWSTAALRRPKTLLLRLRYLRGCCAVDCRLRRAAIAGRG